MDDEVLFSITHGVGTITLNRPKTLNALTMNMINEMRSNFTEWLDDEEIRAILIKGAGDRAFCAGGDVRAVRQSIIEHNGEGTSDLAKSFFYEEYILNHQIHTCQKPYIAFIDRVCMGGGVGLSVHGSHRVATERTTVGMPETTIGLFPDVGGAWFLSRLPGQIGTFLALTGTPVGASDCLALGIATHLVSSDDMDEIEGALHKTDLTNQAHFAIDSILDRYKLVLEETPIYDMRSEIERCFSANSIEEIIDRLRGASTEFSDHALETLSTKSPTSLKVTLEQIRRGGAAKNFAETMQMEYRMSQHFALGHDFPEGVRALLVDKDHKPKWNPNTLEDVSDGFVKSYFDPVKWGDLCIS